MTNSKPAKGSYTLTNTAVAAELASSLLQQKAKTPNRPLYRKAPRKELIVGKMRNGHYRAIGPSRNSRRDSYGNDRFRKS